MDASSYLSGLLIGSEIKEALNFLPISTDDLKSPVEILGEGPLISHYKIA